MPNILGQFDWEGSKNSDWAGFMLKDKLLEKTHVYFPQMVCSSDLEVYISNEHTKEPWVTPHGRVRMFGSGSGCKDLESPLRRKRLHLYSEPKSAIINNSCQ